MRAALGSFDVRMVDNAGYASGLASSLKTGIAALPQDAAGALVALGDMPEVTSGHIDMLLQAFVREHGNAIDPAITIPTLPEFAPVTTGQMLATVKIIPFAAAGPLAERDAPTADSGGVIGLHSFHPRRARAVKTVVPDLKQARLVTHC